METTAETTGAALREKAQKVQRIEVGRITRQNLSIDLFSWLKLGALMMFKCALKKRLNRLDHHDEVSPRRIVSSRVASSSCRLQELFKLVDAGRLFKDSGT